jgi:hypothetical protein
MKRVYVLVRLHGKGFSRRVTFSIGESSGRAAAYSSDRQGATEVQDGQRDRATSLPRVRARLILERRKLFAYVENQS